MSFYWKVASKIPAGYVVSTASKTRGQAKRHLGELMSPWREDAYISEIQIEYFETGKKEVRYAVIVKED